MVMDAKSPLLNISESGWIYIQRVWLNIHANKEAIQYIRFSYSNIEIDLTIVK